MHSSSLYIGASAAMFSAPTPGAWLRRLLSSAAPGDPKGALGKANTRRTNVWFRAKVVVPEFSLRGADPNMGQGSIHEPLALVGR